MILPYIDMFPLGPADKIDTLKLTTRSQQQRLEQNCLRDHWSTWVHHPLFYPSMLGLQIKTIKQLFVTSPRRILDSEFPDSLVNPHSPAKNQH